MNLEKSVFSKTELEFLGWKIKADGIALSEHHIKGIKGSKPPTTMKQVQQILGKLNYYRQFMPMISLHRVELQKLVNVNQLPNKIFRRY